MLIGSYYGVLSPKRRTAIPRKFLKELGMKIILSKWYENCIVLTGEAYWLALLKRLTGRQSTPVEPIRDTERFIMGSAFELMPDDQGRVIIPEELAVYAGLSEKLVFIGCFDRVEIWDEELWRERLKGVTNDAGKLLEKIAKQKNE